MKGFTKKGAPTKDNYSDYPNGLKPRIICLSEDTDNWLLKDAERKHRDLKSYIQCLCDEKAEKIKKNWEKEEKENQSTETEQSHSAPTPEAEQTN